MRHETCRPILAQARAPCGQHGHDLFCPACESPLTAAGAGRAFRPAGIGAIIFLVSPSSPRHIGGLSLLSPRTVHYSVMNARAWIRAGGAAVAANRDSGADGVRFWLKAWLRC